MPIYHCSATTISRGSGRSSCAASAYRAGEKITDERTGITHDFTRKGGVLHSEIFVPAGSPSWARNRSELWNHAELAEEKSTKCSTATTAREFNIALPHELDSDAKLASASEFALYLVATYGVAVDLCIHEPGKDGDKRNDHAHLMITDRRITDEGFAGKVRELNIFNGGKANITSIREQWAKIANRFLERAGLHECIDHHSYKTQWIDREPTTHLGVAATALERRGVATERGDRNRAAQEINALRAEFEELGEMLHAEELAEMYEDKEAAEIEAIEEADAAAILEILTATRSTFTVRDVDATLRKTVHDSAQREKLNGEIFSMAELVCLAEKDGQPITRFTTEAVLQHEAEGLEAARKLAADGSHAVSRNTLIAVAERGYFGSMSEEQYAAFLQATGTDGLAIIAGEAGTGKSYAANAIRTAYETEGAHVVGLAVTNKVVQDMKCGGFMHTRTVHGALQDAAKGCFGWHKKTVLIIDEAGMLSTSQLGDIMKAASSAGAKVITIQDIEQLGSAFSRGGLAGAIEEQHPESVSRLSEIRRIRSTAPLAEFQKRAFNLMHEHRYKEALQLFDKGGAIYWTQTKDEAREALALKYAADLAERPEARRFALANSNADVKELNAVLREVHKARGDLGEDKTLHTKEGPAEFSTGDRIQFTGSAYRKAEKEAGLANSNHGTIESIHGQRVTVALDAAKGEQARWLSFTVGENAQAGEFNTFRHGYAGTVYRSQGSTLDEVYRLHVGTERAAANYVGNTRHTDRLNIFTSREAVRGLQPWMAEQGGLDALPEGKRESAERSYQAWAQENPTLGAKYDLANYVGYVQDKWDDDKARALDIEQLARQMGRREENRAASQFVRVDIPQAATNDKGRAATEKGKDKATSAGGIDPADMVGRTTDPSREADALWEQHKLDQQKATETPKQSATKKITNKELIKIAEEKAKIKKEQRRQERDHPRQGRGRGRGR